MKNTAWYEKDLLPKNMVDGALGNNGWPKLENTDHFKILKGLIDLCQFETICDIGCGAGELGRVLKTDKYFGYDLNHIVENVSKVVNPNLSFFYFDAYDSDFSEFAQYDLLVCNGFLSELNDVENVLEKLIKNTKNSLIIHRQNFSDETHYTNYTTYASLETPRSYISWDYFGKILKNHVIVKEIKSDYGKSILIRNKDVHK